jgi:hypothetical protein
VAFDFVIKDSVSKGITAKKSNGEAHRKNCCTESGTCEEKSKKVKLLTKRIRVGVYISGCTPRLIFGE